MKFRYYANGNGWILEDFITDKWYKHGIYTSVSECERVISEYAVKCKLAKELDKLKKETMVYAEVDDNGNYI
jgi:hypothetical protein